MSDVAIRVENLGKQYRIGGPQAQYKTIRESLAGTVQAPFRRLASAIRGQSYGASNETIWALKDVSFEVKRGEVVGVIGRNGAGKTTLLKILSRITEPTEGWADIHGRVGSLLEVGTGFHPELTGRENIFLSGAILGMKKHEIERKFDEIVAFAEIEKFMDTPVKRYSSGMYVRLAFAVAAHLEPEILLVDEVLAVGDTAFQKKCLGKMGNVAKEGRTILFVSHNLAAVESLCDLGILLHKGHLMQNGAIGSVLHAYLALSHAISSLPLIERADRQGSGDVRVERCRFFVDDLEGEPVEEIRLGDEVYIDLALTSRRERSAFIGIIVNDAFGRKVYYFSSRQCGLAAQLKCGHNRVALHIPFVPLLDGLYSVSTVVVDERTIERLDVVEDAAFFRMLPRDLHNTGMPVTAYQGIVHIDHSWHFSAIQKV